MELRTRLAMLCRRWAFIAVTVFTAVVLFLQLGSLGDRLGVGAFWLSLVLLPAERYLHQLAGWMARTSLPRYVLLSTIALVWAWANSRFRGGGGPFHIEIIGNWRGYPFPFEKWIFILNPSPASLREFHWFGLAGDVLISTGVFLVFLRWLQRSSSSVEKNRALLLVGFTAAFVWLNVDYWVGGLPVTWVGSQQAISISHARRGFPFPYEVLLPVPDWESSILIIDVATGLMAWTALYYARSTARLIQSRMT